MSPSQIEQTNLERLGRWGARLTDQGATAMIVVGVRIGSREPLCCVPLEVSSEIAVALLRRMADTIEAMDHSVN